eukprot:TCONS_00020705-protein
MSEENVAVYRRRKTSRTEGADTRQRVIGGIGRRKVSGANAIQGRIQQFAGGENAITENPKEENESSKFTIGVNSPRLRRSSSNSSTGTNSGSISEIRASRRQTNLSRSNSSASSSTESTSSITVTAKPSTTNTNSDVKSTSNSSVETVPNASETDTMTSSTTVRYGAINTPGRSRRVSVATSTGKEHSQNPTLRKRTDSESSLNQGSLLRSKQMKWENLANEKKEEKARTPSLYRRKFSTNEEVKVNLPYTSDEKKEEPEKPALTRNLGTRGSMRIRTQTKGIEVSSSAESKVELAIKNATKSNEITSKTDRLTRTNSVTSRLQSSDQTNSSTTSPKEKKVPPPVAPKRSASFKNTSSSIAQLQSQLEKDFVDKPISSKSSTSVVEEKPVEKKRYGLGSPRSSQQIKKDSPPQSTSNLTSPTTSKENISNVNKIKHRFRDVNNNDSTTTTNNGTDSPKRHSNGSESSDDKSGTDKTDSSTPSKTGSTTPAPVRKKSNIPLKTPGSTENLQKKYGNSWRNTNVNKSFDHFSTRDVVTSNNGITTKNDRKNFFQNTDDKTSAEKEKENVTTAINGYNNTKSPTISNLIETDSNTKHHNSSNHDKKTQSKISPVSSSTQIKVHSNSLKGTINGERNEDKTSDFQNVMDDPSNDTKLKAEVNDLIDRLDNNSDPVNVVEQENCRDGKKTNDTGEAESIANSFHAVKELVDQNQVSEQKKRQGDIFLKENNNSLLRGRVTYVNEKSNFVFDTGLNSDNKYTNGINSDAIVVEKRLLENNYAKQKTINTDIRLPTRDRSNTWTTTSDSEDNFLSSEVFSPEEKDQSASSSSSSVKYEEKDAFGRRRRLTKKRSKRSKTRPKIYMRNIQNRSLDTSDADVLESNYTSDDFSTSRSRELSSAAESTICESDLNDNYESLDLSLTNKSINLPTVKNNIETQYSENNHNRIRVSEPTIRNSKIAELKEANRKVLIYDGSMKSSSMTTITKPLQQQNLMSLSSSNMGGSRSEDEGSKLFNLHKNKDERIGSVTSISKVRVLNFNAPSFKSTRSVSADTNHMHSTSYSDISHSNNNSIKSSPFSLSSSFNKPSLDGHMSDRRSDEEVEKKERLELLKQGPLFNRDKPFTFNNKPQIPDEESKKNAEVLNSLPNARNYMSERYVQDCENNMKSKSAGNLSTMMNTISIEKEIDVDGDFSSNTFPKSQSFSDSLDIQQSHNTDYIAPPENFQDELTASPARSPRKIRNRPSLNAFSSKTFTNIDEENKVSLDEDDAFVPESPCLKDTEINEIKIPKVPPPPQDGDSQEVKVRKRPGLPNISTTQMVKDTNKIVSPTQEENRVITPPNTNEEKLGHEVESEDEDLNILKQVVENKTENKRSRPRQPIVVPPFLDNIPEIPFSLKSREDSRKKKQQKYGFQEPTIEEEPAKCDSPKPQEQDVDSQSQGSRSTPRDLSMEDLSSELETENKDEETPKEWTQTSKPTTPTSFSFNEDTTNDLDASIRSPTTPSSANTPSSATLYDETQTVTVVQNDNISIPVINTPEVDVKPVSPAPKTKTPKQEMRRHVLQNLLDTEKSYVNNMESMLTMFYHPLKRPDNNIIEPTLVDEIFYQIPELLDNHKHFYEDITARIDDWSDSQIIGDIFINQFTKHNLMDAYSNFINNFVQAKDAIRQASSRPQFTKYIETCSQKHHEKLTLNDLLIMPVQRIPRYMLILKDLLKYTTPEHPDYDSLERAMQEIKTLADRMNKGEVEADQAEKDIEKLRDIEHTIEGISDLVTNTRKFIRQDLVAENKGSITKKDRCLFLFSNLLVCTTVRRKNNVLRRNSLFNGQSTPEFNRYKFVWKLALENIEICKVSNPQQNGGSRELEKLEDDIRILNDILNMSDNISVPHQNMENSIREQLNEVRALIQEKQTQSPQTTLSPSLSRIELQAQTEDDVENYTFQFLSAECKSSWEAYFNDAKQKLAYSRDAFPPEFQYPTPITKTRSGMQFTCAAPSYINSFTGASTEENRMPGDVWVCNSDGYVGQVCLLSMIPGVQSKASLSVCSARIVCIAVIPGGRLKSDKNSNNVSNLPKISDTPRKKSKRRKQAFSTDVSDDDDNSGASAIMAFDSSGDEDDPPMSNHYMGVTGVGMNFGGGRISPGDSSLGATESMDGDRGSSDDDYTSDEDEQTNMQNEQDEDDEGLDAKACMWLGTEDRHIYIYNAQDTIPQRKSRVRLTMKSPVTSILYHENKVFVALSGGELCIYKRDLNGVWDLTAPETVQVSMTGSNITCMTAVAGRIWCGSQNTILLVNVTSFSLESPIKVHPEHTRTVHKIVSSGLGVWVSIQSSAVVRLYHATTYENLLDLDVSKAVEKMLNGADAIIKQHKLACLRVTSLLICKDLLWIGTSAGVVLTNPLPSITANMSVPVLRNNGPTGSPHGHTGHVRFLTSVEVPKGSFKTTDHDQRDLSRVSPSPSRDRLKRVDSNKYKELDSNDTNGTMTLVVSGGDGYEDFKYSQQNETVGRDDSTNHLLLWRV